MKLLWRLLYSQLTVFSVGLLLTGAVAYQVSERALTDETLNHLESVAVIQEQRVVRALLSREERLVLMSSLTELRRSLEEFSRSANPRAQARMTGIIKEALRSIEGFESIFVVDMQGRIIAATDAGAIGRSMLDHPVYAAASASPVVDYIERSPSGRLQSVLGAPLALGGRTIGVVIIEASAEDLLRIVRDYSGLGATGESLIAKRASDGGALFITPLRFDSQASMRRQVGADQQNLPIIQAMKQREIIMRDAVNYRGRPVLAVTRYLEGPDWGLVVITEIEEAYAPLRRLRNWFIAIFATSLAAAVLVSVTEANVIAAAVRRLVGMAENVARDEHSAAEEMALEPEISGIKEVDKLAVSLRQMAATLIDRNKELVRTLEDRNRAFEELEQAQARLVEAERLAALGETVSGIAHEVNTPLGIIATAASQLKEQSSQVSAQFQDGSLGKSGLEKYLSQSEQISELLESSAQRAATLMRSYKTVSIDQASGEERSIALREYIEEVLLSLRHVTTRHPVEIRVHGPDGISLRTRPGALVQVITNLVENALVHAFGDGKAGVIDIAVSLEGENAICEFSDNGCGMSAEVRDRVFEKFFTTRREKGGSGVGMHVVREVVERQLGGSIHMESEEGRGTTFRITLPRGRVTI